MPTPEQDKADAELFRGILRTLLVEKNRHLLTQVAVALPPALMSPLMQRAQTINGDK